MKRETTHGPLYRLIYCSRSALPAGADLAGEVAAILAAARPRNEAEGLTGALLAAPSGFAQVLEGPREVVEHAFQRISDDRRHRDVAMLTFTPAPQRVFAGRPLALCADMQATATDRMEGILADTTRGDERAITGGDLLRLLTRLARSEDGWAA